MKVEILKEAGYNEALKGLSLNKHCFDNQRIIQVAQKLAPLGDGHNKFLRQIQVWALVTAPIAWWYHFDTYKVGITRQSESIMHTASELTSFHAKVEPEVIRHYIKLLERYEHGEIDIDTLRCNAPMGLMAKSVVTMNYENIRNIYNQRKSHKSRFWSEFLTQLIANLEHPELIRKG